MILSPYTFELCWKFPRTVKGGTILDQMHLVSKSIFKNIFCTLWTADITYLLSIIKMKKDKINQNKNNFERTQNSNVFLDYSMKITLACCLISAACKRKIGPSIPATNLLLLSGCSLSLCGLTLRWGYRSTSHREATIKQACQFTWMV